MFWSNTPLCPSCPPCVRTAEASAGKNLLWLLFHCTSLRVPQLIHFPGRNKCTQKSAHALGIRSAQDVPGLLHRLHRWQKRVQQGRDVLDGLNFLCMHKLSPQHTGTRWSVTDEPLSLHLHCCAEVWLAVSSLWARASGNWGQNRWMEGAATAAEAQSMGSEDYQSHSRD